MQGHKASDRSSGNYDGYDGPGFESHKELFSLLSSFSRKRLQCECVEFWQPTTSKDSSPVNCGSRASTV